MSTTGAASPRDGGLDAFSGLLDRCMRTIDASMTQMQDGLAAATGQIKGLQETVAKQQEKIRELETERDNMRARIDGVVDNNSLLEKDIKQQITDNAAAMHRELLVHRTGTKMDLSNMKNSLQKSLNESIQKFEEAQSEIRKSENASRATVISGGNGGGADAEMVSNLVQRMFQLESSVVSTANIGSILDQNFNNEASTLHKLSHNLECLRTDVTRLSAENNFLKEAIKVDKTKANVTVPKGDQHDDLETADFDQLLQMRIPSVGPRTKRFGRSPSLRSDENTPVLNEAGAELIQEQKDVAGETKDETAEKSEKSEKSTEVGIIKQDIGAVYEPQLEIIENSIDAYTIAESDDMFNRITKLESFATENNMIQFQVRRLFDGISELKVEFDSMHTKLAAVRASADDSSNPDKVLIRAILKSREEWSSFYHDLVYALEIVADEDADREENSLRQQAMMSVTEEGEDEDEGIYDNEEENKDLFIPKLRELEELLKTNLETFEIVNSSGTDTAFQLFPQLDQLTLKAEEIIEYEKGVRESKATSNLDIRTFEDVYCMDRTKSLKSRLANACNNTYPIMDKNVTTITMRRRVEVAEELINKKANQTQLTFIDTDIRKLLSSKAEHEDLINVASKKASVVEVQKIKDILTRQIDQFKRGSAPGVGGGNPDIDVNEALGKGANLKAELTEVQKRFDLLFKHFQDLQAYCNGFHATREEVNEAFVHVLSEVKGLKTTSVPFDLFKDTMKTKADALELKKLVSSLAETMGNLNGRGDASIVHVPMKCLTCNKPATHVSSPDERKSILYSRSVDSIPLSDDFDDQSGIGHFPHTHAGKLDLVKANTVARPTSKFIPSKKKDVMELPPIDKPDKADTKEGLGAANSIIGSLQNKVRSK